MEKNKKKIFSYVLAFILGVAITAIVLLATTGGFLTGRVGGFSNFGQEVSSMRSFDPNLLEEMRDINLEQSIRGQFEYEGPKPGELCLTECQLTAKAEDTDLMIEALGTSLSQSIISAKNSHSQDFMRLLGYLGIYSVGNIWYYDEALDQYHAAGAGPGN
jgi:hypothetical protein